MKKRIPIIIIIVIAVVGLSMLLFPTVSSYFNSLNQSRSVAHYAEIAEGMDNEQLDDIKTAVDNYNMTLLHSRHELINGEPVGNAYKSLMNIDDDGMIGYLSINRIGLQLPIYHGTSESVLSNGIGHMEGSSLPLGGTGTHCVLTGHRGVPNSELFTNLDKLDIGDIFTITVLDEVLTYEVDKISIVSPDDDSLLSIDENGDFVTLLTCTPYTVNTHRLLVRGTRIENNTSATALRVTADAVKVDPNIVALFIMLPMIAVLVFVIIIKGVISKCQKNHTFYL